MLSTWSRQIPSKDFDGFVKIEDEAFESMFESSPLHGGILRNACDRKKCLSEVCNIQIGPFMTIMALVHIKAMVSDDSSTASLVELLMSVQGITGCFVQRFYLFSLVLRKLRL